jgi:hypothetical protein
MEAENAAVSARAQSVVFFFAGAKKQNRMTTDP